MYHIKKEDLNPGLQYKLISASVVPRPVGWVTSLNREDDIVNIAPFSFFNGAGVGLLTLAVMRNGYDMKDTARNIVDTGEAVIHIVSKGIEEHMNATAAPLPRHMSELDRTDLTLTESSTVKVPAIAEAKIRFEVKVNSHVEVKNEHGFVTTDFFIFDVTDYYFAEDVLNRERLHVDVKALNPISRLAGNNYATLSEIYSMERPTR